ncbi:hypothetical protein GCM10009565_87530 [Amycolatopsis albidoflavus]
MEGQNGRVRQGGHEATRTPAPACSAKAMASGANRRVRQMRAGHDAARKPAPIRPPQVMSA